MEQHHLPSSFLSLCFIPLLISCSRVSGVGASAPVQPLHADLKPADPPVRLPGEECLAAETHRGPGGGTKLPALPAGPIHCQHEPAG